MSPQTITENTLFYGDNLPILPREHSHPSKTDRTEHARASPRLLLVPAKERQ